MDLGLDGKVALVAAASRGLGAAIARILAQEGCTVEICSRSLERVEHTASVIASNTGQTVVGSAVDVSTLTRSKAGSMPRHRGTVTSTS